MVPPRSGPPGRHRCVHAVVARRVHRPCCTGAPLETPRGSRGRRGAARGRCGGGPGRVSRPHAGPLVASRRTPVGTGVFRPRNAARVARPSRCGRRPVRGRARPGLAASCRASRGLSPHSGRYGCVPSSKRRAGREAVAVRSAAGAGAGPAGSRGLMPGLSWPLAALRSVRVCSVLETPRGSRGRRGAVGGRCGGGPGRVSRPHAGPLVAFCRDSRGLSPHPGRYGCVPSSRRGACHGGVRRNPGGDTPLPTPGRTRGPHA